MKFISLRTSYVSIVVSFVFLTSLNASMILRNNIAPRMHEEAHAYLSSQGHPFYTIPPRIVPEYNFKIETTLEALITKIDGTGASYIDSKEVISAVQNVMHDFITTTLVTIVLRENIDIKTHEIRRHVAHEANINIDHIAPEMRAELHSRTEKVVEHLKHTMHKDNRNYVRTYEIESALKKEFKPLFERIKYEQHAAQNPPYSPEWTNVVGHMYNTSPSYSSAPAFQPTINYKHETCAICLDNYQTADRVGHLSCNHFFHKDCIETWLAKQATCPMCRCTISNIQSVVIVP